MVSNGSGSQLPSEIVGEVAIQLFHDSDRNGNLEDIARCSLVSRAFRDHFQARLFNSIMLPDGERDDQEQAAGITRRLSRLLDCILTRPDLGKHVKTVLVALGLEPRNPDIPKLLELFPSVTNFNLYGIRRVASWARLSPELKAAITAVCSLPSLITLRLTGFPILPSSLLGASPQIKELGVSSVVIFTENEPLNDYSGTPKTDIPATWFTGVNDLTSIHLPGISRTEWLVAAIKASSASGSLRTLSLSAIFPRLSG